MIRDIAVSFKGESRPGVTVTGTIWFNLDGPITKKLIEGMMENFCSEARKQGVTIQPSNLMIVNLLICEA